MQFLTVRIYRQHKQIKGAAVSGSVRAIKGGTDTVISVIGDTVQGVHKF